MESKQLNEAIFQFLKEKTEDAGLLEQIATILEVDSTGNFSSAVLTDLIKSESSITSSFSSKLENLNKSEHFRSYLETVKSKNFFGSLEENSKEYLAKLERVVDKYLQRFPDKAPNEKEEIADNLKNEGNKLLGAGNFEEAIKLYTQAIAQSPTGPKSHIFYSNRAAAHLQLSAPQKAIEDCNLSIGLNSSYPKSYTRLAQAYLDLDDKKMARENLKLCLELDPENVVAKNLMTRAGEETSETVPMAGFPGAGGMPGMPPGMPDLSGIDMNAMLNNPMLKQMAQQMSQDPNMMENLAKMMGNFNPGNPNP